MYVAVPRTLFFAIGADGMSFSVIWGEIASILSDVLINVLTLSANTSFNDFVSSVALWTEISVTVSPFDAMSLNAKFWNQ